MRGRSARLIWTAAWGSALALLTGCGIVADAFDPGFFYALGFDPRTIFPQSGTVIVSFTNEVDVPAIFLAYESRNPQDLTQGSRNFSVEVEPKATSNEVLSCPVGLVSPGSLGTDFQVSAVAAQVIAVAGTTDVQYTGSALASGREFQCGSVIDIRLTVGTGDVPYVVTVRVIPGRP